MNTDPPESSSSSSAMAASASAMVSLMASSSSSSSERRILKLARSVTTAPADNISGNNNLDNDDDDGSNINGDTNEEDPTTIPTVTLQQQQQHPAAAERVLQFPKLISATVSKQRDQPAGLTLISNNGVIISAISPTSPFHADNYCHEANNDSHNSNISMTIVNDTNVEVGVGNHILENGGRTTIDTHEQTNNIDNTNIHSNNTSSILLQNTSLQVNDEILLINSHRVKNPHRAVQLIKGTRSGQLTIVVSRQQSRNSISNIGGGGGGGGGVGGGGDSVGGGRKEGERQQQQQQQGMSYVLARVDNSHPLATTRSTSRADVHEEVAEVVIVGDEIKPSSSTIQHGDNNIVYGLQFSSLSPPPSTSSTTNVSLTRISYKSNTTGPFINTDLKLGDILLGVDGNVVRSVNDAQRLLMLSSSSSRSSNSTTTGGGLDEACTRHENSRKTSSNDTRVVIMLVYSLWDLRRRVLEQALHMDSAAAAASATGEDSAADSAGSAAVVGQQLWQASYSYELPNQNEEVEQKEYIILRIQNTTVTFLLEFDSNGTCYCRDHYQSLLSLDSMEEQQRQSREIQNAMIRKNNNTGADSESMASGDNSTYSRDDALAALELLYQIHVVPLIDALNCHTRRQLRLLAEAVLATDAIAVSSPPTCTTLMPQTNSIDGGVDNDEGNSTSPSPSAYVDIVPSATIDETIDSSAEKEKVERQQQQIPAPPKETTTLQKKYNLDHKPGNLVGIRTFAKPQTEQWMAYVRNQSTPEHPSLTENGKGRGSPKRVPRRHSVEEYPTKMFNAGIPRIIRRDTDEGPSNASRTRRQIVDEGGNVDNSPELNPNRVINKPLPNLGSTNKSNIAHNQPRPHVKLQRKPSIVPEFNLHHASFRSALSALSDSDDDSTGSDTTTTDSDDSESSSDSGSSDDDDEHSEQSQQSRIRREQYRQVSRSPNDSQLILYSPVVHEEESKKIIPSANTDYTPSFKRRLKMRNGDIRKFYKVLHHVVGTGSFGTVRTCVHRSTRQRYVVKSILINDDMKNATLLRDEIALVQRVNHRNVVSVRDVIQDRQFIHIIMEKCHGGDLFDKIVNGGVRLSEDRVCVILSELMDAVAYLHERNIVHRDLKVSFSIT